MIRGAVALARANLPSVLVLAGALTMLVKLVSGDVDQTDGVGPGSIPSLVPLPPSHRAAGAAIQQSALFDPGRRPETIAGSVDDLRAGIQAPAAPVTIAGVLLSHGARKAMLSLGGAAPAWSGVGAELGGWRVAAVDAEGAVLERDGQSVTLKVADRYKLHGKASAGSDGAVGTEPDTPTHPDAMTPPPGDPVPPPNP